MRELALKQGVYLLLVDQSTFSWNQLITELKQLYHIVSSSIKRPLLDTTTR